MSQYDLDWERDHAMSDEKEAAPQQTPSEWEKLNAHVTGRPVPRRAPQSPAQGTAGSNNAPTLNAAQVSRTTAQEWQALEDHFETRELTVGEKQQAIIEAEYERIKNGTDEAPAFKVQTVTTGESWINRNYHYLMLGAMAAELILLVVLVVK